MPRGIYPRKSKGKPIPWLLKANLGSKHSEEHKRKIGLASKGNQYAKGYIAPEEVREKHRLIMLGNKRALGKNLGEKHHAWKGDEAKYGTIHDWVQYHLGKPEKCMKCSKKSERIEWASISHQAKRDLTDYMPLCPKCHRHYDRNPIAMKSVA